MLTADHVLQRTKKGPFFYSTVMMHAFVKIVEHLLFFQQIAFLSEFGILLYTCNTHIYARLN